jgi:hypothetical protein
MTPPTRARPHGASPRVARATPATRAPATTRAGKSGGKSGSAPPVAAATTVETVDLPAPHDYQRRAADDYTRRLLARDMGAIDFDASDPNNVRMTGGDACYRLAQGAAATGMLEPAAQVAVLNGAMGGLGTEPVAVRARVAAALLLEIGPTSAVEGLLAAQMIATQHLAMTMLKRATLAEQPSEAVDRCVTRAVRLQRVFLEQAAALAKLRGGGSQQRVTVEHLHKHVHGHVHGAGGDLAAVAAVAATATAPAVLTPGGEGANADAA